MTQKAQNAPGNFGEILKTKLDAFVDLLGGGDEARKAEARRYAEGLVSNALQTEKSLDALVAFKEDGTPVGAVETPTEPVALATPATTEVSTETTETAVPVAPVEVTGTVETVETEKAKAGNMPSENDTTAPAPKARPPMPSDGREPPDKPDPMEDGPAEYLSEMRVDEFGEMITMAFMAAMSPIVEAIGASQAESSKVVAQVKEAMVKAVEESAGKSVEVKTLAAEQTALREKHAAEVKALEDQIVAAKAEAKAEREAYEKAQAERQTALEAQLKELRTTLYEEQPAILRTGYTASTAEDTVLSTDKLKELGVVNEKGEQIAGGPSRDPLDQFFGNFGRPA